jgi:glycosyltransferase involved in cell wall biosynthesis
MKLTVLSVGYPLSPVSPDTSGGAEQILSMLDEALVEAGHQSIVVAPEASRCRGLLLPTPKVGSVLDNRVHALVCARVRHIIASALSRFSVDVIHLHGIDFLDYLPQSGPPAVITLHLPPAWYPAEAFRLQRPATQLVCVSHTQAAHCPRSAQTRVIENGIRLDRFHAARRKSHYVVALSRICPEKGLHWAFDAASRCGLPLILAGTVFGYSMHREYFRDVLRPRIECPHRYVGPVGMRRKGALLAGARCAVITSRVAETSSLVAMEALASGTPVAALRAGALPEIVEHGRTGFLVGAPEHLAAAISAASQLSPALCRQSAVKRFSARRMITQYFDLYREIASHNAATHPRMAA